jgi:hypothetical protein
MEHSRKPTEQETENIIDDMVRLYRLDENLMPDMCGREDIVGHELNTDEDEARSVLSGAKVIVTDMDDRAGVIFWGGEFGIWVSILTEVDNKLCLIAKEHIELMYWGTSGK